MNKSFHKSTVTDPLGVSIPHEALQASSKAKRPSNRSCATALIAISHGLLCSEVRKITNGGISPSE